MQSIPEVINRNRIVNVTLIVVSALTICRVLLAASTDLTQDEAYYWIWSKSLALSYYDHPPMIAYWIRIGTTLWGDTAWGVRFVTLISILAGSYLIYRTSIVLFKDQTAAALCVFWLNSTLLANAASLIATPDTPLVFSTATFLFSLAKLIDSQDGRYWYAIGASLGFAFLSKYTAVLLLPGLFLWMVLIADGRQWFFRIYTYLSSVLALIIVSPVFIWNANHGWASFIKQANHSVKDHPQHALSSFGEFVAGQAGLVTPLIYIICLWGSLNAFVTGIKTKDTRFLALGSLSAPLLAFFFVHSFSQKIQPNWPGFIYLAAIIAGVHCILAANREDQRSIWFRQLVRLAPYIGLLFVAVVFIQLAFSILPLSPKKDPTSRLKGWQALSNAIKDIRQAQHADLILTNKYALTGELAFHLGSTNDVLQVNQRIRYVNLPKADLTRLDQPALFVTKSGSQTSDIISVFETIQQLTVVERKVGTVPVEAYDIYLVLGYRGGLFDDRK